MAGCCTNTERDLPGQELVAECRSGWKVGHCGNSGFIDEVNGETSRKEEWIYILK
jgi:hypothetical protein